MLQILFGVWFGAMLMSLTAFIVTRQMARDASWVKVCRRERTKLLQLADEVRSIADEGTTPNGGEVTPSTLLWASRWADRFNDEQWWDEPNARVTGAPEE